jgi:hypothetical protein
MGSNRRGQLEGQSSSFFTELHADRQAIDKAAKEEVDVAVTEAKESPQPDIKDFWTDIYVSHLRSILEYEADEISTRVPSHRSCVDERRRRFTTTRHWNGVEVYLFFFHASGSLDDVQSSEMLKRQHTGLLQRMLHPLTDRRSTWPWLCAVTFGHE